MPSKKCDVIVIGAGPAGSSMGLFLSEKGLDTVLVEKKKVPEKPIRCAGYVPAAFVALFDRRLGCLDSHTEGMETYIDFRLASSLRAPGYMIDRKTFVSENIGLFKDLGGNFYSSSKAISITDISSGKKELFEVGILRDGRLHTVIAKIIIGAGGHSSLVSRALYGHAMQPFMLGINQVVRTIKKNASKNTKVFFSKDIRCGYAWLFPRDKYANMGLGFSDGEKPVSVYKGLFRSYLDKIAKDGYIPVGKALTGIIPTGGIRKDPASGGMLVIGDEAGLCNPITGAGVYNAVLSAKLALGPVEAAIRKGDHAFLKGLADIYEKEFSVSLCRALEKRMYMEKNWDGTDFSGLIKNCWPAFRQYWS